MTLNLLVGEVRYSPARDVAYLWPGLLATLADRLEDRADPEIHKILDEHGITLDDLGEAVGALCRFANSSHKNLDDNMSQCLEKSGWHDAKPEARIACLYYIGAMIVGTFFKGIREAIPENDNRELPVLDDLVQAARQFEAYVSMPRWRRWLCRWSKWFHRMFLRAKAVRRPV